MCAATLAQAHAHARAHEPFAEQAKSPPPRPPGKWPQSGGEEAAGCGGNTQPPPPNPSPAKAHLLLRGRGVGMHTDTDAHLFSPCAVAFFPPSKLYTPRCVCGCFTSVAHRCESRHPHAGHSVAGKRPAEQARPPPRSLSGRVRHSSSAGTNQHAAQFIAARRCSPSEATRPDAMKARHCPCWREAALY